MFVDCGINYPQISVCNKYHNSIFSFALDREVKVWMTIDPALTFKGVRFWLYGFTDFHVIFRGCKQTNLPPQCSLFMDVVSVLKGKVIFKATCWWTVIGIKGNVLNKCLGICHPMGRTRVDEWVQLLLTRIHLSCESVEVQVIPCF